MKKQLVFLLMAFIATSLWAGNTITYTATSKLSGYYGSLSVGKTTFGPTITSHTFNNGTGVITCNGEVTTIGYGAFYDCSGLTSVTIPNSVTTIGDCAFEECIGLTSVTIGNSVTTIGSNAFLLCFNLTSVTIPNSVKTIGNGAFDGCSGLTSVTIGNSVTTIGYYAFYDCSGLTSVTIGNSVTAIGIDAFDGCSGLTKTNYTGTIADWCKIKFSNSYANPIYYSYNFYINDVEVKDLVIPDGVDTIGNYAFGYCRGLTSVTIPNSVKTIGDCAFYDCSGLTSITIGNSVTKIGDWAFSNCSGLTSVTIPNSVKTIGNSAFSWCTGLTSITCYATNPPTCGSSCFSNVDMSIPVYVPAHSVNAYKNAYGWKSFTNLEANPDDLAVITCNMIGYGTQTGAGIYIKGDICILTIIPDNGYQFMRWNDGDTNNPRSFVVTQDSIFTAQIDTMFSEKCGDNLIWKYSDGILVISGTGAMYDYTQGTAPWTLFKDSISSLVINNGCTSIGNFAFYNLSNKNLKTIDIPNSVEQIGQYAFANCEYVKNLYLGLSLEKIAANAFANDERLLYITCYAIEPPLLDESAFANYDAYLSVPCESQADYKVSKGWKLFNKENVSCIGAEETPVTKDEVTVVPEANQATFTWPQNEQAAGYSIEITKDGVVFCTLKFNAQGQLTGIAFAPSRGGQAREMAAATMTANGWQFTVTGLNQASKYGYTLDAVNASQQSIKHYEGEFATDGYVGLYTLPYEGKDGIGSAKFIRHNQLLIRHNGNLYNALGGKVR